jgi:hypothetical protein
VREVGVHLEDQVGPVGERHVEAGEVGAPESLLVRPVEHADALDLPGQAIGDLTGAVGRVVVHDQDRVLEPGALQLRQGGPNERLDVLGLVVGREDEPGSGQGGA